MEDLSDDHETSSEWKFEEHIYFEAGRWPVGKTYEDAVRAAVEEQYLPTVPVPVHRKESFYKSEAEPHMELLKLPIRGYVHCHCTGKISEPTRTRVEKMDRSSCVGVGKDPGRNSVACNVHTSMILDTQEKTDAWNADRFPWRRMGPEFLGLRETTHYSLPRAQETAD